MKNVDLPIEWPDDTLLQMRSSSRIMGKDYDQTYWAVMRRFDKTLRDMVDHNPDLRKFAKNEHIQPNQSLPRRFLERHLDTVDRIYRTAEVLVRGELREEFRPKFAFFLSQDQRTLFGEFSEDLNPDQARVIKILADRATKNPSNPWMRQMDVYAKLKPRGQIGKLRDIFRKKLRIWKHLFMFRENNRFIRLSETVKFP